jgi:hypothetical protein
MAAKVQREVPIGMQGFTGASRAGGVRPEADCRFGQRLFACRTVPLLSAGREFPLARRCVLLKMQLP